MHEIIQVDEKQGWHVVEEHWEVGSGSSMLAIRLEPLLMHTIADISAMVSP